MLKNSKICQLFTESVISLEFTELLSDSIIIKDNSMPTFSTTAHGHYSQLIRNLLFKKSEYKKQEMIMHQSLSQARISLLKNKKLLFFKTWENGHNNTSINTMWFQTICTFHWIKFNNKREILILLPKLHKSLKWTSTQMN